MITKPLLAVQADLAQINYPVIGTPKLDGIRCLISGDKAVSRNWKPIPNQHVRDVLYGLPDGLDGELMLKNTKASFQEITSAVMSFEGEPAFKYHVFDFVPDSYALQEPYQSRLLKLKRIVETESDFPLVYVPTCLIENESELLQFEKMNLDFGFEGIMIRDPFGKYKCGRSTVKEGILLKIKRFEDSEAEIIALIKRQKNNNEQTRDELGRAKRSTAKAGKVNLEDLGAFIVKDLKTDIEFQIGSGLNDQIRADVWKDRMGTIGRIIKYKYQPTGVKEAPRFPVFLGFRDSADL